MDEEAVPETIPAERCTCGVAKPSPWAGQRLRGSVIAAIFGLLVICLGLVLVSFDHLRLAGAIILAVWLVATVAASLVAARQGHRGGCLVKRSLWFGVLTLGAPVQLAFELP